MTTSTPPAWHWLHECYVPVKAPELSFHSHKLPESDALRERNDSPDPTGEDIWPLDRDQCPDCRCAPNTPHAPGCESTAQVANAQSNAAPAHTDCDGVQSVRERPKKLRVGARNEHPDLPPAPDTAPSGDVAGNDDNPLLNHMERTFSSCLDIAAAKNHDYAADVDPFLNFRECGRFGVGIDSGILVRMSDKWSRLCNLAKPGRTVAVCDETLVDTVLDLINYAAILVAVYEDKA